MKYRSTLLKWGAFGCIYKKDVILLYKAFLLKSGITYHIGKNTALKRKTD